MSNIDTIGYGKTGRIFAAANVSAKIVTVVGTAMTGLILYNPPGSDKYLSIMRASYSMTTALASISSLGLAIATAQPVIPASTTVGSASIKCANGGPNNSVAQVYDVATLAVAPVAVSWFAGQDWVTGGTGQSPYSWVNAVEGELGLVPGAAICFCMIGATGPTGMGAIKYIEIDL